MENRSLTYWRGFSFLMVALNVTVLLYLLLKPAPPAEPMRQRPGNEEGGPARFIIEQLQFTREQERAFNQLKKAHRDSVNALQHEGRLLRESLFTGLQSDTPYAAKEELANKIANNQKQIELVTYDHFAAVRALCSPQQKIIFNEIIGEVLERMAPHRPPPERRP